MSSENFKMRDLPNNIKDLKSLFSAVKQKIDFINQGYSQISEWKMFENIHNAYKDIYGEKDEQGNVIKVWKLQELEDAYNQIIIDWNEESSKSLKTQIEVFLNTLKEDQVTIEDLKKEFLWYTDENTNEEVQWFKKNIEMNTSKIYLRLRNYLIFQLLGNS